MKFDPASGMARYMVSHGMDPNEDYQVARISRMGSEVLVYLKRKCPTCRAESNFRKEGECGGWYLHSFLPECKHIAFPGCICLPKIEE